MAARVTVPEAGDVHPGRWLGAPSVPLPLGGEERLARLAGEGSQRAFATLYERYHQPLYRYCRSLVRNEADAQDALQSTFTAAFAALRRGQRDAPLRPWLFRIAHNESITLLRRRRPDVALSEATESTVPSAAHSAEDRARLASLVGDLSDLPERQRGALVMRELSGLSHEQIAEAFGISVGAAKQTIFEARRSLAEFAEGRTVACEEIQRVISDGDGRARRARRVRAHLRDCTRCAAFAAAISDRETDLRALSPVLPIAAASGILVRVTGAGSGHSSGAGGLAAGATSKAATTVVSLKAATAGVAVVTAAVAGTAGVLHRSPTHHARGSVSGHVRAAPGRASGTSGPPAAGSGTGAAGPGAHAGRASGLSAWSAASRAADGSARATAGVRGSGARGHSGAAPGHGGAGSAAASHGGTAGHPGATGNHGTAGNHLGAAKGSSAGGRHLGAIKQPNSGKHLGATKSAGAGTHLGATKGSSSGKHGATAHSSAGSSRGGATTHTGTSGATPGQGSSGHPQKPAVANSPASSPTSSPSAHGSDQTRAGQTESAAGGPGSSTATASSISAAPTADLPASANGQPQASGSGQDPKK